jgi:hypothetical protein
MVAASHRVWAVFESHRKTINRSDVASKLAIMEPRNVMMNRQTRYVIFFLCVAAFDMAMSLLSQGCGNIKASNNARAVESTQPANNNIIGTWQLESITERASGTVHPAHATMIFMRFFEDGSAATWPAPRDVPNTPGPVLNTDANGVSRGHYALRNGLLFLLPGAPNDKGKKLDFADSEFSYLDDEGDLYLWLRVRPDLEPGMLPQK